MGAKLALCPHCGFPVVVKGIEEVFPRNCRQCRGEFVPAGSGSANRAAASKKPVAPRDPRSLLRVRLRHVRRAGA